MLKSVEEEWQGFASMVFRGCKPSETQVQEMKKAFFAGALSLLTAVKEIGEPHIAEDDAAEYLDMREDELEEFFRRLIREYAETN